MKTRYLNGVSKIEDNNISEEKRKFIWKLINYCCIGWTIGSVAGIFINHFLN